LQLLLPFWEAWPWLRQRPTDMVAMEDMDVATEDTVDTEEAMAMEAIEESVMPMLIQLP